MSTAISLAGRLPVLADLMAALAIPGPVRAFSVGARVLRDEDGLAGETTRRRDRQRGTRAASARAREAVMTEIDRHSRLRPNRVRPVIGTVLGAAAGFAFYLFFGCDSG